MARFLYHNSTGVWPRIRVVILVIGWIFGLICGYYLYIYADASLISVMRGALHTPVSIVGLVGTLAVPLLFSATAVFISGFTLLPLLAWTKGVLFSFASVCALSAFGSGSWLIWPLLLFSDIICVCFLWWYWLKVAFGRRIISVLPMVSGLLTAGILDYFFLSPFLAGL